MLNRDLTVISLGERLWIARRAAGVTQREMARRVKMTEKAYNRIERDLDDCPRQCMLKMPKEMTGHLCALARRRDGRTLRRLAVVLGAGTHVTLLAWEGAGDKRLKVAWEKLGYRF